MSRVIRPAPLWSRTLPTAQRNTPLAAPVRQSAARQPSGAVRPWRYSGGNATEDPGGLRSRSDLGGAIRSMRPAGLSAARRTSGANRSRPSSGAKRSSEARKSARPLRISAAQSGACHVRPDPRPPRQRPDPQPAPIRSETQPRTRTLRGRTASVRSIPVDASRRLICRPHASAKPQSANPVARGGAPQVWGVVRHRHRSARYASATPPVEPVQATALVRGRFSPLRLGPVSAVCEAWPAALRAWGEAPRGRPAARSSVCHCCAAGALSACETGLARPGC